MSINAVAMLADGFEETEAIAVIDVLLRAKVNVTTMSISGKLDVVGSHEIVVKADEIFDQNKALKYDLIFLPGGGLGTKNLCACKSLIEVLRDFAKKDKIIAAICAAPTVLNCAGLLSGKQFTCYPGFEQNIDGVFKTDKVVQDGNIFTSRGMGTAIDF